MTTNSYNKKQQNIHVKGGGRSDNFFLLVLSYFFLFFFFFPYLSFSFRAEEESDFLIPFLLPSDAENNLGYFLRPTFLWDFSLFSIIKY